MGHSSQEVSKRMREEVKGEKSASFLVFCTRPMLSRHRVTVRNPATGQDLCT